MAPVTPTSPTRIQAISLSASPEKTAAIVAALERFMRTTSPQSAARLSATPG